jgi:hypothetical protein
MCSACEGKPIGPHVAVDREVVRRARDIESAMAGERVPETAWDIFFGFAGGAVEWRHYQRIHQAYEEAERGRIRLHRGLTYYGNVMQRATTTPASR